jgi:hypothetical protein
MGQPSTFARVLSSPAELPGRETATGERGAAPRLFKATAAERKLMPVVDGFMSYFPDAIAAGSHVSYVGNQQHNPGEPWKPGEPLHWAQEKSNDHLNCIGRHLAQIGTLDVDGVPHSWKLFWRAAAHLQMELQAEGAPVPRGAKLPPR